MRVYLPPDTNCLLSVADHCLRSRDYVNVIVAGKQPSPNFLTMDQALAHCTRGIGIWEGFSSDGDQEPDVVLGCAGDVPTLEAVAAAGLLREHLPELKVRVVNVVNLMRLEPDTVHPHGLSDLEFDALFTTERPVIFAYHGYPALIHRLTYRRTNHDDFHVRGYNEEGTTTTPFDMVVLNDLDRYHLVMDVIDRVPGLAERAGRLRQDMADERLRHRAYTREHRRGPARRHRLELACWSDTRQGEATRNMTTGSPRVLVVNAGSSSLKLTLLDGDNTTIAARELRAPRAQVNAEELRAALDSPLRKADEIRRATMHNGSSSNKAGSRLGLRLKAVD